jgi:hypothetical protein
MEREGIPYSLAEAKRLADTICDQYIREMMLWLIAEVHGWKRRAGLCQMADEPIVIVEGT